MATTPKRFCLKKQYLQDAGFKNLENWIYTKNNVYIARNKQKYVKNAEKDSKWENTFPEWEHGVEESHKLYEEHVRNNTHLMKSLKYLSGKYLGCWCEPDKQCHGDVIIKVYNEHKKEMMKKEKMKKQKHQ